MVSVARQADGEWQETSGNTQADGMPLSSVDPTPRVLQAGGIRGGIDFPIDTDTIFTDSFEP